MRFLRGQAKPGLAGMVHRLAEKSYIKQIQGLSALHPARASQPEMEGCCWGHRDSDSSPGAGSTEACYRIHGGSPRSQRTRSGPGRSLRYGGLSRGLPLTRAVVARAWTWLLHQPSPDSQYCFMRKERALREWGGLPPL